MSSIEAPKITITEASPMPPPNEGRVQKEEAASAEASVSIPATTKVASSGEFQPSAEDCHDCRGETTTPDVQQEDRAEREPSEDIPTYTRTEWCLLHYCRIWTQDLGLKFLLIFEVLLLAVFACAAYMGAAYISECTLNASIPVLMLIIGVNGFSSALGSSILTVRKLYRTTSESCLENLVYPGAILTIMLIVTLSMIMLMSSPSDEPGNKNFCEKTFITYVTYFIWSSVGLLLAVLGFLGLKKLVKHIRNERTTQENGNEQ